MCAQEISKRRYELFRKGLPIECVKHGSHSNWREFKDPKGRPNIHCKLCELGHKRKWRASDPIATVLSDIKKPLQNLWS